MKKLVLLLLLGLISVANIQAQDEKKEYFDLLMLYLDADYEKLLKKAEKYMDNDKTRKDALPYLYAAMGYFDIKDNEELSEVYKNPLRESLKLATKFVRYDRTNAYAEEGDDFIAKLRAEIKNEAIFELKEGKDSRAQYYFKQLLRLDENDYSVIYMQLQLAAREGDTYTQNEMQAEFNRMIENVTDWSKEASDKKNFLEYAMLEHADYLKEKGRTDAALKVVTQLEKFVGVTAKTTEFKKSN
ncbi:hypothetical protein [Luteibaculum oceani]|uniref:Tetratricopeptide repeat protein n=1 Tax=Luteibaculum oceani TaxID=1294296 RepID=A0A5C6V263_9FLAO|nr:hypothetical protein [Luteibaculum oceani]TXC77135.1 hypothetical protein FRX97_09740 [Luteibaculum oceani]